MVFPVASSPYSGSNPSPAYAGTFIPEIWSGKVVESFYDATVIAAISNTDYEGEIANMGDRVQIRTKPTITINTYEANQAITVERPSSSIVTLNIDKGRYFSTVLDDVMQVQSDLDQLSMWADDASEQMKINIDTLILDEMLGDCAAANRGTAAGAISGDINLGVTTTPRTVVARNPAAGEIEVLDLITNMGQVLDEQNIPETGRWIVIPAWMAAQIKRSELRDASLTGDGTSMARNGRLGMIDRFTLYMSNLLPTGTSSASLTGSEFGVFAGHSHGLTFASQMTKMETLRAETSFGTVMRGLQVFGYLVVDGTAVAEAVVVKG